MAKKFYFDQYKFSYDMEEKDVEEYQKINNNYWLLDYILCCFN